MVKWWVVNLKQQRDKAYEFVQKGELNLADVRLLQYLDQDTLVAGRMGGDINVLDSEVRQRAIEAVDTRKRERQKQEDEATLAANAARAAAAASTSPPVATGDGAH